MSYKVWSLGFLMYAIGSLIGAAALSFGPGALLMPLGTLKLAVFTLLAGAFLGESVGWMDASGEPTPHCARRGQPNPGIACIILGSMSAVHFGPEESKDAAAQSAAGMVTHFWDPGFMTHSGVVLLAGTGMVAIILWQESKHATAQLPQWVALAYALLVGICSSFTILFTKCVALIVALSLSTSNQFIGASSWTLLVLFLISNVSSEFWRQRGLSVFPAVLVIPICEVGLLILGIIANGLFFCEFKGMVSRQWIGFGLSILLVCFGVGILSLKQARQLTVAEVGSSVVVVSRAAKTWREHLAAKNAATPTSNGHDDDGMSPPPGFSPGDHFHSPNLEEQQRRLELVKTPLPMVIGQLDWITSFGGTVPAGLQSWMSVARARVAGRAQLGEFWQLKGPGAVLHHARRHLVSPSDIMKL
eukprot:TRINITY_DN9626_c0_g1_i2.p1 TRINITY_DN9626_c0_g1~~TRINITY_DN9626_c0_g1_i2.p1  ORF type:complete len:417 (-),score=85.05 TRINITY_DN9626_c0_g1_i2:180-1430(-)